MKMTWKKTQSNAANNAARKRKIVNPDLPFDYATCDTDTSAAAEPPKEPEDSRNDGGRNTSGAGSDVGDEKKKNIAQEFEAQGNKLAEEGRYREALSKWETAITLMPGHAVLHEQKAQVLLELGDAWNALKAAARAAELEPTWAEAWITVGRAQLNFGEPDSAIESFDKALAIKPESKDAKDDRLTTSHLVKRRKQLHSTGLSLNESRFLVGDQG
ncbi:tetratricopeptide repeat protein 33 [Dorcoceras hygrometricum]|uniref:Tetratricopeptide repeat protein 33 n=1 Tax=Dorcoceras hygrometricum TaxID=472368 RepID=A0A2Z7B376_9LAMI|nr:tetratricopeptide repeat protein 33 [Dorcoceras hygrometricum]